MSEFPIVGVGAVVIYNAKVLLVQRAKPPYVGQWCIPGGKIKFGESLQQAAEREILEETGIQIKAGEPVYTFDIIESKNDETAIHYVVVDLQADYVAGSIKAGGDALDAAWFSKSELEHDDIQVLTRDFLKRWWVQSG